MTMTRKDSYTFMPDRFPSGYTEAQKHAHYQEQKYRFITEALLTPYEKVTQALKDTWHSLGLRMAMPNTGIGRSMQDDIKIHQAKYAWRNEQARKAYSLNQTVSKWCGNTKTFIKTLMRV